MKKPIFLILLVLTVGIMNCQAQKRNSIKILLSTENSSWQLNGEMPVKLSIKNLLASDIDLKIHSIRFHLSPDGENLWQTYLVPNSANEEIVWKIKKGETIEKQYDLSKLTLLNFNGNSAQTNPKEGKYKITLVLQIFEKDKENPAKYESNVFVNLFKELSDAGKKLNETSLFVVGQTNKGFISLNEVALREILPEKYAESSFKYIIHNGTPEGKLYGLLGLKLLQSNDFPEQLEIVRKTINLEKRIDTPEAIPAGKVRTQSGCLGSVGDSLLIIQQIANGDFDRILDTKADKKGKILY